MAAILKRDEVGTRSARRIARDRVKSALKTLGPGKISDGAVHAARKELKKARAVLRLLRDALGESTYKKENAALRDAARPLGDVRDGRVLVDALRSLVKYYGAPASALPLTDFQRALNRRRTELRKEVLDKPSPLRGVRKKLRRIRSRSGHWRVGRHGWSVLGGGLKRTYSQGRDAFRLARTAPTSEHLHEWRKQTKYFWHQLQVFEPLSPGPLRKMVDETHKLTDFLGDDHDLAVLHQRAVAAREEFPTTASHRALLALIERCQKGLQEKALQLGQHLYDEKPAVFTARLGKYWEDWRHSSEREKASQGEKAPQSKKAS